MSALNEGAILLACGKVEYTAGVPAFVWQNGGFVDAIGDTGLGDALLSLDDEYQVDPTDRIVQVNPRGGAPNTNIQVVDVDDTDIQVLGFVAAAPADADFNIWVWQRKQG
jgi:hypothetical protein